ncbi:MAG: hypothetical protein ACJZ7A_03665 [Opitutales bacterium]
MDDYLPGESPQKYIDKNDSKRTPFADENTKFTDINNFGKDKNESYSNGEIKDLDLLEEILNVLDSPSLPPIAFRDQEPDILGQLRQDEALGEKAFLNPTLTQELKILGRSPHSIGIGLFSILRGKPVDATPEDYFNSPTVRAFRKENPQNKDDIFTIIQEIYQQADKNGTLDELKKDDLLFFQHYSYLYPKDLEEYLGKVKLGSALKTLWLESGIRRNEPTFSKPPPVIATFDSELKTVYDYNRQLADYFKDSNYRQFYEQGELELEKISKEIIRLVPKIFRQNIMQEVRHDPDIFLDPNYGINALKDEPREMLRHSLRYAYLKTDQTIQLKDFSRSKLDPFPNAKSMTTPVLDKQLEHLAKTRKFRNKVILAMNTSVQAVTQALPRNACLIEFIYDELDLTHYAALLDWRGECQIIRLGPLHSLLCEEFKNLKTFLYKRTDGDDSIKVEGIGNITISDDNFLSLDEASWSYAKQAPEESVLKIMVNMHEIIMAPIIRKLPKGTDTLILNTPPPDNFIPSQEPHTKENPINQVPFPVLLQPDSVEKPRYSNESEIVRDVSVLLSILVVGLISLQTRKRLQACNVVGWAYIFWLLLGTSLCFLSIAASGLFSSVEKLSTAVAVCLFPYLAWSIFCDLQKVFSATSLSGKRRIIYAFASVFTPITLIVSAILLKVILFYETPELSIIWMLSITFVIWRLLVRRFRGKFAAKDWIIGIGTLAGIPLMVYIIENPDFAKRFVRESENYAGGSFLIEDYDLLYLQSGRDLLDDVPKWKTPNVACTYSNSPEHTKELNASFGSFFNKESIKNHFFSNLNVTRNFGFYPEDFVSYPPELKDFFQEIELNEFVSFSLNEQQLMSQPDLKKDHAFDHFLPVLLKQNHLFQELLTNYPALSNTGRSRDVSPLVYIFKKIWEDWQENTHIQWSKQGGYWMPPDDSSCASIRNFCIEFEGDDIGIGMWWSRSDNPYIAPSPLDSFNVGRLEKSSPSYSETYPWYVQGNKDSIDTGIAFVGFHKSKACILQPMRLLLQKILHLVYAQWKPVNERAAHAFLCDFYAEAIRTGNPPRAFAKIQREKILNAKTKLEAIRDYAPFRLIFRGPVQ